MALQNDPSRAAVRPVHDLLRSNGLGTNTNYTFVAPSSRSIVLNSVSSLNISHHDHVIFHLAWFHNETDRHTNTCACACACACACVRACVRVCACARARMFACFLL